MVKPVELFYTLVYRSFRQNKKVSHGYTTKETLNISKAGKGRLYREASTVHRKHGDMFYVKS
jgi:hypothetical protein